MCPYHIYFSLSAIHIYVELCVEFLKRQADDLALPMQTYYPADPKKPVIILTWIGREPELPSIILNSHMDVVPVFEEHWTHPPFGAEIDADGKIYARGTQDMKCCGTMYLGAIRHLKRNGISLKRTVHVVFVPGIYTICSEWRSS